MTMSAEDRPDVALHPPSIIFASMIIGFVIRAFAGGWLPLPKLVGEGLGGVMMIGAMVLMVASVKTFAEGSEELRPSTPSNQLFTGGPFQWSRNPIYVAMVLFGAGFGFATFNLWIILTSIVSGVIFNFFVIPKEEEYLSRRFGSDYDAYKTRVRRWL